MESQECVRSRVVLWWMMFTGDALGFIALTNIALAIVEMVNRAVMHPETRLSKSQCLLNTTTAYTGNSSYKEAYSHIENKFDWDEHQQSLILTAALWIPIIFQILGGIPGQKYGGKSVFGIGILLLCVLGALIPTCAHVNFYLLLFILMLQGTVSCFAWPAAATLIAKWAPPNERSIFSTIYKGKSAGLALHFPMCGQLMYWFGWHTVFYFTGILGVVWFVLWWLLVFDDPLEHPRISPSEKKYILESLRATVSYNKFQLPVPWRDILTSLPVWLLFFTTFGNVWCVNTLTIQTPTYIHTIHGKSIQMTGLVTGIPHIIRFTSSIATSPVFDWLLSSNKISRNNVRKIATAICCLGQALFMACLAYSGCNFSVAITCMMLSMACSGTDAAGQIASLADISPNFVGVLLAILQTALCLSTLGSVAIPGLITYHNRTVEAWQTVFLISALIALVPDIFHLIFGTAELQSWNSPREENKVNKEVLNKNYYPTKPSREDRDKDDTSIFLEC